MTDYYQHQYQAPAIGMRNPDDLTRPLYGASFGEATKRFFKSAFRYQGRASQSEYWWTWLLYVILFVAVFASSLIGGALENTVPVLSWIFLCLAIAGLLLGLAMGVANIALSVRRLHDANASGWWYLLVCVVGIVPMIGAVGPIVIGVLASNPAGIRFDQRDPSVQSAQV